MEQSLARKSPAFCLLVLSSLSADAQSNAPVELTHPSFSSPPLEIRTMESLEVDRAQALSVLHQETSLEAKIDQAATVDPEAEWTADDFLRGIAPIESGSRFELEFHNGRDLVDYLKPPPIRSDSLIDRVLVDPFTPVGIPVGKAAVSFSVITAVKRKNPLCLLNPIVLIISW